MAKSKKRKKRAKPTPDELERRSHRNEVRSVLFHTGFYRMTGISDTEIEFQGRRGEFDDIYIYENIVVIAEYTTVKKVTEHLTKKKLLFDHIVKHPEKFIEYLDEKFAKLKERRNGIYDNHHCKIVVLYCSKHSIDDALRAQLPNVVFFDYPIVKYFRSLANSIRKSARFEFMDFLKLDPREIGERVIDTKDGVKRVDGTVLPESHSNFSTGYKVVSFYIDPATLLEKSYVMRKHGWKDETGLYQRMIITGKIRSIRKYLNREERVFINNIIVTLPGDARILDAKNNTVDPATLKKTKSVTIEIPDGSNVIGLIDGQHRVFAYHEGGVFEEKIARLRQKQNLLVTGIIYPEGLSGGDKAKFEAQMFLEINSNQTNAKSDLKQSINVILKPFSAESIASVVVSKLNRQGPLTNSFEEYFFEKGKIKTTSIVSYGLKPLVKLSGTDSLFAMWNHQSKDTLLGERDLVLLEEYIKFCTSQLSLYFSAIKAVLEDSDKWTTDKKIKNKVLSTTAINGFIICFRLLIENKKTKRSFEAYKTAFDKLDTFNFGKYKSSQYGTLARDIFAKFFES